MFMYISGKGEAGRWEVSLSVYRLQNLGTQITYHLRGCTLYHFPWKLLLNLNPVVILKQIVFSPTNIILLQDTPFDFQASVEEADDFCLPGNTKYQLTIVGWYACFLSASGFVFLLFFFLFESVYKHTVVVNNYLIISI